MNGRKYGPHYWTKTHGVARGQRATVPVSLCAPKRHYPLHEVMWDNLIGKMKRIACGGCPDELWSQDGRVRKICWGRTLGWWEKQVEDS